MTSPGEAHAQTMYHAIRVLRELSPDELTEYKSAIEVIASKYDFDEKMGGLTAKGKLSAIKQVLSEESP